MTKHQAKYRIYNRTTGVELYCNEAACAEDAIARFITDVCPGDPTGVSNDPDIVAEEVEREYDLDLVKFCSNDEVLREHLAARGVPDERLEQAAETLYDEIDHRMNSFAADCQAPPRALQHGRRVVSLRPWRTLGCPVADSTFASWQGRRPARTLLDSLVSMPTAWLDTERGRELARDFERMVDLAVDLALSTHTQGDQA